MGVKNINYTGHHINLQKKENFSPYFQGITPRSLVPVLVDDGEVHIESNDILKYLDNKFPTLSLIPKDKEEEINKMMIEENDLHLDIRNVTFKFLGLSLATINLITSLLICFTSGYIIKNEKNK